MKKVLYIVFFLVTLCPLLSDGSMALAQRMASEGGGSLWDAADETGYFYEERCEYCDVFISGTSDKEFKKNMEEHLKNCPKKKELEEEYKNDEEDYDFTANGEYNTDFGDTDNNGSNYNQGNGSDGAVEVVDIYVAARALEAIGIGMQLVIINDFYSYYGGSVTGSLIPVNLFSQFIQRMYGASKHESSYNNPSIVLIRRNKIYGNCIYYDVSAYNWTNYDYIFYF